MEKKEIEIGRPLTVVGVSLIPIVELSVTCRSHKKFLSAYGVRRPVSIVVVTPAMKKAFRSSGEEVTLEQLVAEVPALREIFRSV